MGIVEFNQLNEVEKEEVVLDEGSFIFAGHDAGIVYDVYKVETFFVQISYRLNEIERLSIQASSDLNQLNAYIINGYSQEELI